MEVMIQSPPHDFNFESTCTTPYISAPSSPQRLNTFFYSAPTSPTRISAVYGGFRSEIPFNWEETPGIPKSDEINDTHYDDVDDFAFDFSGQLDLSAADELFDGGKIKPLKLKPPPRFQYDKSSDSPRSPKSPKLRFKEAFSPRPRKKESDPFEEAAMEVQSRTEKDEKIEGRGRERIKKSENSSSSRHKSTRSLSPFRVSDLLFDRETNQENAKNSVSSSSSSSSSSSLLSLWQRKWKLKDLLLFRSASEGRASSEDESNKYGLFKKSHHEDEKSSSIRSTGSRDSSISSSRRRGSISAHEMHYTMNRAASEEMKKKTVLPYKHGLLGCLLLQSGSHDTISKGVASMSMSRRL